MTVTKALEIAQVRPEQMVEAFLRDDLKGCLEAALINTSYVFSLLPLIAQEALLTTASRQAKDLTVTKAIDQIGCDGDTLIDAYVNGRIDACVEIELRGTQFDFMTFPVEARSALISKVHEKIQQTIEQSVMRSMGSTQNDLSLIVHSLCEGDLEKFIGTKLCCPSLVFENLPSLLRSSIAVTVATKLAGNVIDSLSMNPQKCHRLMHENKLSPSLCDMLPKVPDEQRAVIFSAAVQRARQFVNFGKKNNPFFKPSIILSLH